MNICKEILSKCQRTLLLFKPTMYSKHIPLQHVVLSKPFYPNESLVNNEFWSPNTVTDILIFPEIEYESLFLIPIFSSCFSILFFSKLLSSTKIPLPF